jgi:hypothetical protein
MSLLAVLGGADDVVLRSGQDVEDFEQEMVGEYALANPRLLITRRSAPRLVPVSRTFPWRISSVKPRALRDDRILAEVRATGGDPRRLADLFGVSIDTAGRYVDTLEHPDLDAAGTHVPGTSTPT